MNYNNIGTGEFRFVSEIINGECKENDSVRTIGKINSFSPLINQVEIEYNSARLLVDVSLAQTISINEGELYMFIGEIHYQSGTPILYARISKNVETLNTVLFEKAIQMQRNFLQKLET